MDMAPNGSRIWSLLEDGTHLWIWISNGLGTLLFQQPGCTQLTDNGTRVYLAICRNRLHSCFLVVGDRKRESEKELAQELWARHYIIEGYFVERILRDHRDWIRPPSRSWPRDPRIIGGIFQMFGLIFFGVSWLFGSTTWGCLWLWWPLIEIMIK